MSLFNRNNNQQVPEVEIQGDEAIIPTPDDEQKEEAKKPKKVKFDPKTWGHN
jgi:hypothetical protein